MRLKTIWLITLVLIIFGIITNNPLMIIFALFIAVLITILKFSISYKETGAYIPEDIKDQVLQRQGGHCGFPGCSEKNYLHLHHLKPKHLGGAVKDPANLVYVCPNHHSMMHDSQNDIRTVRYNT